MFRPWPAVVIGGLCIGILIVSTFIDKTLARAIANGMAGALMGLTFMVMGWYSQQSIIRKELARIKLFMARNAAITHVTYSLVVFLIAILLSNSVFGMQFTGVDFLPGSAVIVGGLLGLLMYFGLEMDAGFQGGSGAEL